MKKFRMFAVFLITILLAGCAGSEGQAFEAGTTTQTPAPAVTSTPAPRSPTPSSTSFWRIVTSMPTPERTMTPTVSPVEIKNFIREMYMTNGGCELPCVWGITPGQDVDEVLDHFSPYDVIRDYSGKYDHDFIIRMNPPKDIDLYSRDEWKIYVRIQDNTVRTVAGDADYLNSYADQDLSILLKSLGSPDEIWIEIYAEMDPIPWYRIALFYREKGILVGWRGTAQYAAVTESSLFATICPRNFGDEINMISYIPPYFVSWSPDEDLSFHEVNRKYAVVEPYHLLTDQNSDIDIEQFYQIYIDIDTEMCFHYTVGEME